MRAFLCQGYENNQIQNGEKLLIIENNLNSFEGFLLFDFYFNDESLQLMVDDIYSAFNS